MLRLLCFFVLCIGIATPNSFYSPSPKARRSPELTLFRAEVAPETGGKVPEAAHMRVELNKLDALGIDDPNAENMIAEMRDMHLPEQMAPGHTPHYDPTVTTTLQTGYKQPEPYHPPSPGYHEPEPYHPPSSYHEPEPYHPPSSYHEPEPYHPPSSYHEPEPYHPPSSYHEPEPYAPPKPEYGAPEPGYGAPEPGYGAPAPYKPKAPVMLAHRPYEPKEIKPVTITTHEANTGFDCRKVPYPDRHYADPEAGCSIYHFCHADGKQDTFHCSYGTIFNEYLGTCDHTSAVYCGKGGEGYAGPPKPQHHGHGHKVHPAPHHQPAYHHPEPEYHHSPPAHHEVSHTGGFSTFNFPSGFGSGF